MKNYFIFFAFFLLHTSITAQGFNDKAKHFSAGFVIGGIGGYTANKIFDGNKYWTWVGAVGSSLAAGITKETIDGSSGDLVETRDVVYTTIGGLASGLFLELLLNKKRKNRRGRGRYRKGKSCGCLVVGIDIEKNKERPIIYIENGSHDIASAIQAKSIYNAY